MEHLKGDLPHYAFVFGNLEPLGTELNNAACSRLGTMLYLEIQNRKEVMKASYFLQQIRGTADCIKITIKDTKGCGQLS